MRKIFGIVAIALLLVAPAFGQNTASIKYYLQLQAGDANGGSQPFVGGSETDGLALAPGSKITWSVRAVASGQYNGVDILGAANLVWDLALTKVGETVTVGDTGSACPVFGLGSGSAAGFYSVWNPGGGGGIPLEAAAFAFQAFGLGDPATVADPVALGGPNMERYQYPSTYQWMGGHGPADPPVGGQVNTLCTAKSGTLMGMGAGYSQYVNHFLQDPEFNTEMGGVAGGNCGLLSGYDAAGGHIIAEGQMNLAGLPAGQYELKLIPGRGNNVLRGDLFACDEYELAGPFAGAGVYDVNTNGDTILFTINDTQAHVKVTLTANGGVDPAPAGAQWSLDGGSTWNASGATVDVAPGTYTVTCADVTGWNTPAPQSTGALVAGQTVNLSADYTPAIVCTDPVVTKAVSRRYHKWATEPAPGTPWDIDLPVATGATAGVECRSGGPQLIIVTYDQALDPAVIPSVTLSAGSVGTVTVSGNEVHIPLSGVPNGAPNNSCRSLTINGAKAACGNTQTVAKVIRFRYRLGDINGLQGAIANDVTVLRQHPTSLQLPVNETDFRYDLNCDNRILANDQTVLRQNTTSLDMSACTNP